MVRDIRIKQYMFSIGSLTLPGTGSIDIYSDHSINGTIQNVVLLANNFTTTGSLLLFASGLSNSGTNLGELIITLRAGSTGDFYPYKYGTVNQAITASGTNQPALFQPIVHAPLRLVGSSLGAASSSGLGLIVNYI